MAKTMEEMLVEVAENVPKVYEAGYNKGLSEIPSGDKWKTLIDTELTEEQGGVSTVKIEIPDIEALKNATRIRTYVDIHAGENEIAQQSVRIKIANYNSQAYGTHLCFSNATSKCGAGQTWKYRGTTEIIPTNAYENAKTALTFYSIPNVNTGANAVNNATKIEGTFPMTYINTHPPYLHIELGSGGLMAAGTKIFMEVCE